MEGRGRPPAQAASLGRVTATQLHRHAMTPDQLNDAMAAAAGYSSSVKDQRTTRPGGVEREREAEILVIGESPSGGSQPAHVSARAPSWRKQESAWDKRARLPGLAAVGRGDRYEGDRSRRISLFSREILTIRLISRLYASGRFEPISGRSNTNRDLIPHAEVVSIPISVDFCPETAQRTRSTWDSFPQKEWVVLPASR